MAASPTAQRRRLSRELRQLRDTDGRTATEVTKELEWPVSKLTRMERNEWLRPSIRDIKDLIDAYGVTDARFREFLLALARQGRKRGWWDTTGMSEHYTTFIGLEAEAATERSFRTLIMSGLLQTEAYAAALMRGGPAEMSEEEIERRVEVRMKRKEILYRDNPLRLWVVLDEAVLRRVIGGPDVMRGQMRHLLEVAQLAKVTLQVIPFEVGAHPGTAGSFAILEFPEEGDLDTVYVEAIPGELFVEEPPEVQQYEVAFQRLTAMALPPDDTIDFIASVERAEA